MKSEELISVIVPVYKVEKYLDKCIQSIVEQTYQNLEIILVDDGSPDICPGICDEWGMKDSRIKVIHKENGGLSSARNAGMAVAKGEYIGFVDSDDYIENNMYEKLYTIIKTEEADLAICNFDIVTERGELIENGLLIKDEVFSGKVGLEKLMQERGWYYVTAWNKLYSRKIVEEMKFPVGKIHEDEFFVHRVFGKCSKIVSISQGLYKYVQRQGSIMNATKGIKKLDVIEAFCDRIMFYKEHNMEEIALNFLPVLKQTYVDKRLDLFGVYTRKKRLRIKEIDKLFYKVYFSYKKDASIKEKVLFYFPTIMYIYFKIKKYL